jgi:hypothetical protein
MNPGTHQYVWQRLCGGGALPRQNGAKPRHHTKPHDNIATPTLYDSRKSIMTGADRNQLVLNPT